MSLAHWRVTPFANILAEFHPGSAVIAGDKTPENKHAEYKGNIPFRLMRVRNHYATFAGFSLRLQTGTLRYVSKKSFDVLVIEGAPGIMSNWAVMLLAWLKRIPTILWLSDWNAPKPTRVQTLLRKVIYDRYVRFASGAICYSRSAVANISRIRGSDEGVFLVQNTINVEDILAMQETHARAGWLLRSELGLEDKIVVLYVGALLKRKRVENLVFAFKHSRKSYPRLALCIVGDGPEREYLKKVAGEDPAILFTGSIIDGIDSYFAMADLFVMPGTGGLAVNQAMAHSKPIISADGDGTIQDLLIDGVNGFLIHEDDIASLSQAINFFCASPEKIIEFGAASAKLIMERASLRVFVRCFADAVVDTIGH